MEIAANVEKDRSPARIETKEKPRPGWKDFSSSNNAKENMKAMQITTARWK